MGPELRTVPRAPHLFPKPLRRRRAFPNEVPQVPGVSTSTKPYQATRLAWAVLLPPRTLAQIVDFRIAFRVTDHHTFLTAPPSAHRCPAPGGPRSSSASCSRPRADAAAELRSHPSPRTSPSRGRTSRH